MHLTQSKRGETKGRAWRVTAEDARHFRLSLEETRERLRVARLRAADRQRLAENALAAGQEGFERAFRDAADAHAATARALEATMVHLERCWSEIEAQRRQRERAMHVQVRGSASAGPDQ